MENRETFLARIEPRYAPSQLNKTLFAYWTAKYMHRAQQRKELVDGVPVRYFEHPRRVALILMDVVGIYDPDMVISALLHDAKEDTDLTAAMIEVMFGIDVTLMVNVLSKTPKEGYLSRFMTCVDWRPFIIKACDRYDNLIHLDDNDPEFIVKQVKETRDKYYPLFYRMLQLVPPEHREGVQRLDRMISNRVDELMRKHNIV